MAFGEPFVVSPPVSTRPRPLLAGLPSPDFRVDGLPAVGAEQPWLLVMAGLVVSAIPAIEHYGIATAEQVGPDTLAESRRWHTH